MYAFHGNGGNARLLCDEPVLFFDDGARRGITIETAKNFARHSAIGPLRTVFVNHVEKSEFNSRCWLPCHCWFLSLFNDGYARYLSAGPDVSLRRSASTTHATSRSLAFDFNVVLGTAL